MEEVKDIRLGTDGDIFFNNGDFDINESDQIHIEHIIISNKGYWFENPLLGVGIINELNGSRTRQELKQTIRRQLVFDDYSVRNIDISSDFKIDINAIRKL